MASYKVSSTELSNVAAGIRNIDSSTDTLKWPSDFISKLETIKSDYNSYKSKADLYDANQADLSTYTTYEESTGVDMSTILTFTSTTTGSALKSVFENYELNYKRNKLENSTATTTEIYGSSKEYVAYVSTKITTGYQSNQILMVPLINGVAQEAPYRFYNPNSDTVTYSDVVNFGVSNLGFTSTTNVAHAGDTFIRVVLTNEG